MPPSRPSELEAIQNASVEPIGTMSQHLGGRIAPENIRLGWSCTAKDRRMKNDVRAYSVKTLLGAEIQVRDDRDLSSAIHNCLQERLPAVDWPSIDVSLAIVRKYMFIHSCFEAPKDEATQQPMSIELFAYLAKFAKQDINEKKRHELHLTRFRSHFADEEAYLSTPIVEDMTFKIDVATYSNIGFPGCGIPFYL